MATITIDEERIKQLIKQALLEVFEEHSNWLRSFVGLQTSPLSGKSRQELVALARRAEGNWKETEARGTSVEVVRRLREEWTMS
jgi:hypothetical protein